LLFGTGEPRSLKSNFAALLKPALPRQTAPGSRDYSAISSGSASTQLMPRRG
jgi:hypothetical protein